MLDRSMSDFSFNPFFPDNYNNFQNNDGEFHNLFDSFSYCEENYNENNKENDQKNDQEKNFKNREQNNSSTKSKTEKSSETKKEKPEKNLLGRKKNGESGLHNKSSFDNITRKIKPILVDTMLDFLNEKISEVNESNSKLAKLNQKQASDTTVTFNQNLLNKNFKDIFSENITLKCTAIISKFGIDYNKKLIQKIYDANKKNGSYENTVKIFERKFLEVLEHCRGSKYYDELKGLKEKFSEKVEKKLKNESEEYKNEFWNVINNFEKEYENRKTRKSKKPKNEGIVICI